MLFKHLICLLLSVASLAPTGEKDLLNTHCLHGGEIYLHLILTSAYKGSTIIYYIRNEMDIESSV